MGASASGKSVLMQVLSGRLPRLHTSGEVTLEGVKMDPNHIQNDVGYVPQDDFLMGELTPRETLFNVYKMKRDDPASQAMARVDSLLQKFGLAHVMNNPIGTVFVRGLSGGQRKRVEVCSELVAPPAVLMLDEPTSGLDGAIAYEVLSAIKEILAESNGKLSLIISIHQPNSRILELFDHIMLVGGGGMIFFGTLAESVQYFDRIGFPAPEIYTPTDVFLQVSDKNFGDNHDFDFEGAFACSPLAARLNLFLEEVKRVGVKRALKSQAEQGDNDPKNSDLKKVIPKVEGVSEKGILLKDIDHKDAEDDWVLSLTRFWRQYFTLLYRDYTLAYRDPSMYYLQFILVSMFGFLVGAAFFKLRRKIDSHINNIPAGLLWIVMMMSYIQVFKVYHLSRADRRFKHENSNKQYSILAYWLAELTATATLLVTFVPGTIFAYFMMDLPGDAYGFMLLNYWMVRSLALFFLVFPLVLRVVIVFDP